MLRVARAAEVVDGGGDEIGDAGKGPRAKGDQPVMQTVTLTRGLVEDPAHMVQIVEGSAGAGLGDGVDVENAARVLKSVGQRVRPAQRVADANAGQAEGLGKGT